MDDEERCSSLGAVGGDVEEDEVEVDDPLDCSRHSLNVDHPVGFFSSTCGSLSSISGSEGRGGKLKPWSSAEG